MNKRRRLLLEVKRLEVFEGCKIDVSDTGEIYTLDHTTIRSNGRIDNRKGKKLKPALDKYGYYRICLTFNGRRKNFSVHRLVATAFLSNPNNKPTVNHINGIKTDNRVCNLEWATNKEQKEHSINHHLCDKNIEALKMANEIRKKPLVLNGIKYESVREASRSTGLAQDTCKKYGKEVMPNE